MPISWFRLISKACFTKIICYHLLFLLMIIKEMDKNLSQKALLPIFLIIKASIYFISYYNILIQNQCQIFIFLELMILIWFSCQKLDQLLTIQGIMFQYKY